MRKLVLFAMFSFWMTNIWALDLKKAHLVNGCVVLNWDGTREKVLPGSFCQFFEDGSFLSGTDQGLKYISKDKEVKWEFKSHLHHQVNLSTDLKRILVMSSQYEKIDFRVDKLIVLNREGEVLFTQSARSLMQQVNAKAYHEKEMTHFNSFYEIPEIVGKVPSYIKKGNFIANSNNVGVFILTPDLKKVLHFFKIPTSQDHQIHDVQVLSSGKMIYFNNIHKNPEEGLSFSTIEEMDLNSGKVDFEFRANPASTFFSRYCGGVQKIDEDTFLFSHMLTGTYVYSISKKKMTNYIYKTHIEDFGRFFPSQQVKAVDLNAFLSHWK